MKKADLSPPLGYPGGHCHVLERIREEVDSIPVKQDLIRTVEKGKDISNAEASKVYDLETERGAGIFRKLIITAHAQYRMDLRSVTVPEVRLALRLFSDDYKNGVSLLKQNVSKPAAKKLQDFTIEVNSLVKARSEIRYTDRHGLTIVFAVQDADTVRLVTAFWQGVKDPSPSSCKLAYRPPVSEWGPKTYVRPPESDGTKIDTAMPQKNFTERRIPQPYSDSSIKFDNSIASPGYVAVPGEDYGHPWKEDATKLRTDKIGYEPRRSEWGKQKKTRGPEKAEDRAYYRENKGDIRRQQKKYKKTLRRDPTYKRLLKVRDRLLDANPDKFRRKSYVGDIHRENLGPSYHVVDNPLVKRDWHTGESSIDSRDFDTLVDNGGSSKVIPIKVGIDSNDLVNHDWENEWERDRGLVAAKIPEILRGTAPKILARPTKPKLVRVDSKNRIWTFMVPSSKTGTYKVRLQASKAGKAKTLSKMDVKVSCSCPFWQWGGPEYHAFREGYLLGKPRGTASTPDIRDPERTARVCKHVASVLALSEDYFVKPLEVRKMGNLKSQLVRLAYENPSLRKHLLPLITAKKVTQEQAYEAYDKALEEGPSDETRRIVCEFEDDGELAFAYAENIDKRPHDDTRRAVCRDGWWATDYAQYVDKGPHDDTRRAACNYEFSAVNYAGMVDKGYHPVTYKAVKGTKYERGYVEKFGTSASKSESKSSDKAFEEAIKGKRFKHPETGNKVLFKSLPAEEQTKIRKEWSKKK